MAEAPVPAPGNGRRRVATGCAAVPVSGVPPPGLQAGLPVGSDALDGRDALDRHALHRAVLVPVYSCGNGAPGAGSSGPVGVRSRVEGTRDIQTKVMTTLFAPTTRTRRRFRHAERQENYADGLNGAPTPSHD